MPFCAWEDVCIGEQLVTQAGGHKPSFSPSSVCLKFQCQRGRDERIPGICLQVSLAVFKFSETVSLEMRQKAIE